MSTCVRKKRKKERRWKSFHFISFHLVMSTHGHETAVTMLPVRGCQCICARVWGGSFFVNQNNFVYPYMNTHMTACVYCQCSYLLIISKLFCDLYSALKVCQYCQVKVVPASGPCRSLQKGDQVFVQITAPKVSLVS